jgi:hypothetical protein
MLVEDEARAEHDVERVAEYEHPHGNRGVAGSPEHRIQQKEQDDGDVAAEHHASKPAARLNHLGRCSHEVEQCGRGRRADRGNQRGHDHTEHDRLARRARSALGVLFAHAPSHERRRADGESHRRRIDHRQHRLGESDRGDGVGAEMSDPEDVDDGEDRLHGHLHDHGNGEHDDRSPHGCGGVIDGGAADRFPERRPDAHRHGRGRALAVVGLGDEGTHERRRGNLTKMRRLD